MNHKALLNNIPFNTAPSKAMHIDLNSCFASIEQQANHLLRGKPIAVAAYDSPNGCILAPSVDAKKFGIKTGMRIKEAKVLYPKLIILEPDPPKYRYIHKRLNKLLSTYTEKIEPKSIDEFVLEFDNHFIHSKYKTTSLNPLLYIGAEIKSRIKNEIGDYLTVSIGIAPNRFLAKTASNLHKPDGLDEINYTNYLEVYKSLELMDLCGINVRNAARLNVHRLYSVLDFYNADTGTLRRAFESKIGYYWHLRLRGFETDNVEWETKTIGHSYSLPIQARTIEEISPILQKLVEKVARRLRKGGFVAHGVHLGMLYNNGTHWHKGEKTSESLFEATTIFKKALHLLYKSPTVNAYAPIRTIHVNTYDLSPNNRLQLALFTDLNKKVTLSKSLDIIADKYGEFTVTNANMMASKELIPDRIAFGKVKDIF